VVLLGLPCIEIVYLNSLLVSLKISNMRTHLVVTYYTAHIINVDDVRLVILLTTTHLKITMNDQCIFIIAKEN